MVLKFPNGVIYDESLEADATVYGVDDFIQGFSYKGEFVSGKFTGTV